MGSYELSKESFEEKQIKILKTNMSIEKQNQFENTDCEKEYIEKICDDCKFKNFKKVSHPGGSPYHSVNKYFCELGYWEDDF